MRRRSTQVPEPSERRKRVALLNAETDIQRQAAADRARSIQTKASFLVVIASLLATISFNPPDTSGFGWLLSLAPLLASLATVASSVVALWPAAAGAIDPAAVREKWIDHTAGSYELEIYLLKLKVVAYEETQKQNDRRMTALKTGFVTLTVAITLSVLVFVAQHLI